MSQCDDTCWRRKPVERCLLWHRARMIATLARPGQEGKWRPPAPNVVEAPSCFQNNLQTCSHKHGRIRRHWEQPGCGLQRIAASEGIEGIKVTLVERDFATSRSAHSNLGCCRTSRDQKLI